MHCGLVFKTAFKDGVKVLNVFKSDLSKGVGLFKSAGKALKTLASSMSGFTKAALAAVAIVAVVKILDALNVHSKVLWTFVCLLDQYRIVMGQTHFRSF